jgi:hypothetical protein
VNWDQIAVGFVVLIAIVAIWLTVRGAKTPENIANPRPAPYDDRGLQLTIPTLAVDQHARPDDYWKARTDGHEEFFRDFDRFFRETTDFSFHANIVGVTHANRDRTRRGPAIKKCVPLEVLVLKPEPDNAEDPFAIAVKRSDNHFQLGYLDWQTARDIRRDMLGGRLCGSDSSSVSGARSQEQ